MALPKDPIMLKSVLNTKLRDLYSSLSELCDREDVQISELLEQLKAADMIYDPAANKII